MVGYGTKGMVGVALRVPWANGFPPVFVHTEWDGTKSCLSTHRDYSRAKRRRDAKAAFRVCDELAHEATLEKIYEVCHSQADAPPLVVAPALSPAETQNALAIGYGRWLAYEMHWDFSERIHQSRKVSRDYKNGWSRLLNEPEYYGAVEAGRRYVIADDVCTMGGTLASLRGFIECQGGHVICMTTLASGSGNDVEVSLAPPTLLKLGGAFDGQIDDILRAEVGHGASCLTEPEGQFILRCPSVDRFREGIAGARDG